MSTEFKYDVIRSHSAKNKAAVRAVAERMRVDGLVCVRRWREQVLVRG